ncbi:hypothetical protein MtrunA17_Chr1g0204921 [Medicago truncatula]|uniref:Uncharacterized protein n=1 Tax=Medicago truncatula TaxID=3880 RepID=A0A396JUF7_MEDTR|nr:hypothetical protein MtrunA17_Chr1g0204921 [Medicago truncatula]
MCRIGFSPLSLKTPSLNQVLGNLDVTPFKRLTKPITLLFYKSNVNLQHNKH